MKVRLTDIAVRNLKPPLKGQATYLDADANLPGFGVRVSSKISQPCAARYFLTAPPT